MPHNADLPPSNVMLDALLLARCGVVLAVVGLQRKRFSHVAVRTKLNAKIHKDFVVLPMCIERTACGNLVMGGC